MFEMAQVYTKSFRMFLKVNLRCKKSKTFRNCRQQPEHSPQYIKINKLLVSLLQPMISGEMMKAWEHLHNCCLFQEQETKSPEKEFSREQQPLFETSIIFLNTLPLDD